MGEGKDDDMTDEPVEPEPSEDEPKIMMMLEHLDGDIALVDRQELADEARRLAAIMMTVEKVSGDSASRELMRISAESKSPAYVQALALEACQLAIHYALEEAMPFQMPIILGNLNRLMLAYRIVRPTPPKDDEPTGAS